jgi:RNA polymerase sigma-70 factor (ECF subfamily)
VPSAIAEDIAIDCTYTLAVRIHQFDSSRGTLHAWIRSSGLNALRDWFRANRHQTKLTYLENLACRPIYGQSLPDEAMHLVVQQALLRLSATDQSIMQMKFHEGLNHRQIADALGISHDNVRKHYERAISRLRTLLQQDRHVQARMLRSRPVATCT